ncbi:MAG: hypothetical protein ACK6D3_10305 [Planctomycetaceae bacterium]|jgi:hypothetical protein
MTDVSRGLLRKTAGRQLWLAALLLPGLVGLPGMALLPGTARAQQAPGETAAAKAGEEPQKDAGQAVEPPAGEDAPAGTKQAGLNSSQEALQRQYRRFEEGLYRIAESLRKTDPERADLLLRAIGKSKEERIVTQMNELSALLRDKKLGDAIEKQEDLIGNLQTILDLLLSEDRQKELQEEQKRIKAYLEEVNKLIGKEKGNRADNERGIARDDVEAQQKKIREQTEQLQQKISKDDAAKNAKSQAKPGARPGDGKSPDKSAEGKSGDSPDGKPSDPKSEDAQAGDSKSGDKKTDETKPGETKPGEQKPGEQKPGENGSDSKPAESKPGESKPGEQSQGTPQSGQPSPPQQGESGQSGQKTPGREELERAREAMERALENLKKNKRQDASDDQDDAVAELQRAKEKLEEILRQLREEEKERFLAMLEARFQRMLAMELLVYDGTVKLSRGSAADQSRQSARGLQLARQQDEIALEATKAVTLLREEGTAVAFPEAVEMMRDDMRQAGKRLERTDVGEITQSIERDIIDALEEMIDALQKEMEKSKKKDQQQQQQDGQQQDQELVDKLAELKMLRTLQLRINNRTRRLGREVEGEQAEAADVIDQLQDLAERQARVQKATYDISTGRNK